MDLGFAAILPAETTKVIIHHIARCCAVRDIAWTKLNREIDEKGESFESLWDILVVFTGAHCRHVKNQLSQMQWHMLCRDPPPSSPTH